MDRDSPPRRDERERRYMAWPLLSANVLRLFVKTLRE